jgi:hypothetical protein
VAEGKFAGGAYVDEEFLLFHGVRIVGEGLEV